MADLTHLRLERPAPGVALLVLDNPDQRNAMSGEMTASWVAAIDELAEDRSVRAVVVTGEGSAFCSGGDTAWLAGEPGATVDEIRTRMIAFYRAWLSIRRLEVPTIAALNGAGDRRRPVPRRWPATCASRRPGAKLGVPFVKLGLHPGMAGTFTAARRRRASPRPATCSSPAGSSRATRRCGWGWSRASSSPTASATRWSRPPPGSRPTRRSPPG